MVKAGIPRDMRRRGTFEEAAWVPYNAPTVTLPSRLQAHFPDSFAYSQQQELLRDARSSQAAAAVEQYAVEAAQTEHAPFRDILATIQGVQAGNAQVVASNRSLLEEQRAHYARLEAAAEAERVAAGHHRQLEAQERAERVAAMAAVPAAAPMAVAPPETDAQLTLRQAREEHHRDLQASRDAMVEANRQTQQLLAAHAEEKLALVEHNKGLMAALLAAQQQGDPTRIEQLKQAIQANKQQIYYVDQRVVNYDARAFVDASQHLALQDASQHLAVDARSATQNVAMAAPPAPALPPPASPAPAPGTPSLPAPGTPATHSLELMDAFVDWKDDPDKWLDAVKRAIEVLQELEHRLGLNSDTEGVITTLVQDVAGSSDPFKEASLAVLHRVWEVVKRSHTNKDKWHGIALRKAQQLIKDLSQRLRPPEAGASKKRGASPARIEDAPADPKKLAVEVAKATGPRTPKGSRLKRLPEQTIDMYLPPPAADVPGSSSSAKPTPSQASTAAPSTAAPSLTDTSQRGREQEKSPATERPKTRSRGRKS